MARGTKKTKARSGGKAGGKKGLIRTWFGRLLAAGLIVSLVGIIALVISVSIARSELPSFTDLKASPNGQMIRVHAADGTVIVAMGPSFGKWLSHDEIPAVMRNAMIAVEDRRFAGHFGVDPIGIARSIKVRFEEGRFTQGGSTITQQLARNIFLSSTKTFGRKFREMILALAIERKFSKEQILELYLNKVYFGGGAYGIDAASRRFFAHPATKLNLAESAIIAGLVKAPSRYSPTADAKAAIGRASVVLTVMQDAGTITAAEAAATKPSEVRLAPEPRQNSVRYFTDWALPQLDLLIDETTKAIDVWTTLDLRMQQAATTAVQAHVPKGAQGALVSLDRDGAVLAMVGGADYVTSNYNRATKAVRQPGSAWKMFVYLTALEGGYSPNDIVTDEPVTIDGWTPRNSGNRYSGDMTVRNAFAYSKNTVAAVIGNDVGFGEVARMARRFGITTPVNTHPSMVLGTSDVRLLDMTKAFGSINAKGAAITPYGITKVTTIDGDVLYEQEVDLSNILIDPWVAAGITDLMQTAVSTGTGRAAQIGRPVAGKTGTTNSNKDGWFMGFSSGIATGVWMGRDDAKPVGGLQGGRAPARAFADYMRVAVAKRKVEQFDTKLVLPEGQSEPDEEAYFGEPDEGVFVDEDGNLIAGSETEVLPDASEPSTTETETAQSAEEPAGTPANEAQEQQPRLDQEWIDSVLGRKGDEQTSDEEAPE